MPGEGTPHGDEARLSPVHTRKVTARMGQWTLDAESRAFRPRLLSLTQTAGSVFRTDPSARVKDKRRRPYRRGTQHGVHD